MFDFKSHFYRLLKKSLDQLTQTFRGYKQFKATQPEVTKAPQGSSQLSRATPEPGDSAGHLG